MKIICAIAWRNLWRHPRRTFLTALTVSLGLALLLVFLGLGDGGHYQMIESAVRLGSGHVVVQKKGYGNAGGAVEQALLPEEQAATASWMAEAKGRFPVRHLLLRTFASGLSSSADGATGVQIMGIEPELEIRASDFHRKLVGGEFLHPGDVDWVVVGEGVARKLAVGVGEKLVLMAQGAHTPEIQSRLVRVRGILRTGLEEFDQLLVLMPLTASQQFLLLGGGVHQMALLMDNERLSELLAAEGQERLPSLEVLSWGQVLPELKDFIRIDDAGSYILNLVIFLLIAFTVMNTLLMSVLERDREFALLDAVGLTPFRRFLMVMLEAVWIAAISAAAGLALGYGIHLYLSIRGLPMDLFYSGDISAAGVAFDPVIYSYLSAGRIVGSTALVFLLALGLALIPARRAAATCDVRLLGQI
ncbi:MAG: ABC transporter permease [Acidobacteria bacterium]|nr:ABC transporter permease [Acidobacteriota bacterium]